MQNGTEALDLLTQQGKCEIINGSLKTLSNRFSPDKTVTIKLC